MLKHYTPKTYNYNDYINLFSIEAMKMHYEGHYMKYVDNYNSLVDDCFRSVIDKSDLLKKMALQIFNHEFFWNGLQKQGQNTLRREYITDQILDDFKQAGIKCFGSGWIGLIKTTDKKIVVRTGYNENHPMCTNEESLLLLCDVWEHAYYVDYYFNRGQFLNKFIQNINWDFVDTNFHSK